MIRFAIAIAVLLISSEFLCAQPPAVNTTIQLPTVRNLSISTVVSVPDGGTLNLTGGSAGAAFSSRPGLRSRARSVAGPGVSISASLIIGAEVDAELERLGREAIALRTRPEIHGTKAEKAKASFLSKHLGRGWK